MKYLAILLIKIYRKIISPLFPKSCKYYPTCSAYAMESYKRHGFIKGTALTVWRVLRCNPWSMGGVDKVPQEFSLTKAIGRRIKRAVLFVGAKIKGKSHK